MCLDPISAINLKFTLSSTSAACLAELNDSNTFDVFIFWRVQVAPHNVVEHLQNNVEHEGGSQFSHDNTHISCYAFIVRSIPRVGHIQLGVVSIQNNNNLQYDFILINIYSVYFRNKQPIQLCFSNINYSLQHWASILTMNQAQQYTYLVNQVQALKKSLNAQKMSHQQTVDQLQMSYSLNQELEGVVKTQNATISSMHRQLAQKNSKITEIVNTYEQQLMDVKDFVNSKEAQLQSIRGAMLVTDYDVIRLRVVSQIQLIHKEQLDQLNKQIERLNKLYNDQKQAKQTSDEKFQHIKKQLQKQAEKYQRQICQKQEQHIRSINRLNDKLQLQKLSRRQLQKSLQSSQKRYNLLQQKYEQQINLNNTTYPNQKPTSILNSKQSFEREDKIGYLKTAIQDKNLQIESLKKKIEKQSARYQQQIHNLEQKVREAKQGSIEYAEHEKKIRQKQKQYEQIISSFEKRIRNMKQDHSEQLRKITKQQDRKIEQLKQKYRTQKQNYSLNINTAKSVQYDRSDRQLRQMESERQKQKMYRQKIRNLQKQLQKMQEQLQINERNNKTQKITVTKQGNIGSRNQRSESTDNYRIKLKEANQQIVTLLLQKVSLKQQIARLQH